MHRAQIIQKGEYARKNVSAQRLEGLVDDQRRRVVVVAAVVVLVVEVEVDVACRRCLSSPVASSPPLLLDLVRVLLIAITDSFVFF